MAYSLIVLWGILPVTNLVISAIIGKDDFKPLIKAVAVIVAGFQRRWYDNRPRFQNYKIKKEKLKKYVPA